MSTSIQKTPKSAIVLWILSMVMIMVVPLLRPDGGISLDSILYFEMAAKLPQVEHNIYPIGYPLILKIFNLPFQDYFWAAKWLSAALIFAVGIFSIKKQFYPTATLILLSFKVVVSIFYFSYSETVYLPALYFLFYCIHQYFEGKWSAKKLIVWGTFWFLLLYSIRYTTAYIGLGLGVFYVIYLIQNGRLKHFFKDPFFYFLLACFLSMMAYIGWSLYTFGSAFGEDLRQGPDTSNLFEFTSQNIIGLLNVANPIYSIKLRPLYGSKWIVQGIITAIDLFFLIFAYRLIKKNRQLARQPFWLCVLSQIIVFALAIFASEYINYIDYINTRMIIVSSCLLFFMVLVFLSKFKAHWTRYAIILGFVSLVFNVFFAVRIPINYLSYREKVKIALEAKPEAKYFFEDITIPVITNYYIPLVDKTLSYQHAYYQDAYINEHILMLERPGFKPIESAAGIDSQLVIFQSEIPE